MKMVIIMIVEAVGRDGSDGGGRKGIRWTIVRDDRLRGMRPWLELGTVVPRVIGVGRLLPILVRKLRHGPLCEGSRQKGGR